MALDNTEQALLVAAAVFGALLLLVRIQLRRGKLSGALRLFDTEDTRSPEELDRFFMKRADDERAERQRLWVQAQTDPAAARELRRRLLQDIETDQLARKEFGPDPESTPELMAQIEDSERATRDQLAKLDAMIGQLRA